MSNSELIPAMAPPTGAGLRLLRRRWKVVALLGLAGALAAAAHYLWSPKWYSADLLIVPKRNPADLNPARNLLGNLPFDVGGSSLLGQSDADRIAAILASRTVTDAIIAKFDLMRRYED